MLLKDPPPLVIDHAPLDTLPPTVAPDNEIEVGLADSQTVFGPPASTVGAVLTVTTTVEVAAVQGPAPSGSFVVKVRVTFPLAMLGV